MGKSEISRQYHLGPAVAAVCLVGAVVAGGVLTWFESASDNTNTTSAIRTVPVVELLTSHLEDLEPSPAIHQVRLRIANPGGKPIRFVGFQNSCTENSCTRLDPTISMPITLSAGASEEIEVQLQVGSRGEFVAPLIFFFDADGLFQLELSLKGSCRDTQASVPAAEDSRRMPAQTRCGNDLCALLEAAAPT